MASLGETKFQSYGRKDVILASQRFGPVGLIRLAVEKAPVEITEMEIGFMSGVAMKVRVNEMLNPGGSTQPIQFKNRKGAVRSVEITYVRTKWGDNRPVVTLLGR